MLGEARRERVTERYVADDDVERLLLDAVPDAHHLATWILRDPLLAEDAVHDAVLIAWNRRRSIRSADTVGGWFVRIVVNICRDELRRQRRRPAVAPLEPETSSALGGVEDPAARAHEYDDLTAAIERLSEDEQVVLGLRFGRDLTVPQIAALTGFREGTVKSRLHHALDHLHAALDAERRTEEMTWEAHR